MKLNLGSGDVKIPGFENIDRKMGMEVYPLTCKGRWEASPNVPEPVKDGVIDEIRASHILEHFPQAKVFEVVKHWVSKLKTGGRIRIAVPDLRKVCDGYLNRKKGEKINTAGYLMGGQVDDNDFHQSIFDEETLRQIMEHAGLTNIEPWVSDVQDCAALPMSLNLQGSKAEGNRVQFDCSKITAVMSMPRIAFTDNMFSAMRALMPYGINLYRGSGVFWEQVLSRLIENAIEAGAEYILAIDYDTWFKPEHVMALAKLMLEYPPADVICPVQTMREKNSPLVGIRSETGEIVTDVSLERLSGDLIQIVSGHFGLTLFRASAFKKLPKPWFHAQPNSDGDWGDGRQDADIYFWNKFATAGLKAFMANHVTIGHLQMMCTFAGKPEDNWKPIHLYMNDVEAGKMPDHCIPH